jgi:hypothetical protein
MDMEASGWHCLCRASGSCYGGGVGAVIGEGMELIEETKKNLAKDKKSKENLPESS